MANLFLLTDSFPFGKGEDFIINEIDFLSSSFEKVYVIPTGMMCDISICRKTPDNFVILKPPKARYLYNNKSLSKKDRIIWAIQYLSIWCLKCLINKEFLKEIYFLIKENKLSIKKLGIIFKCFSPCLKNISHYKKQINDNMFSKNINFIYSFWFDSSHYMMNKIINDLDAQYSFYHFSRGHRHDIYEEENDAKYLPFRRLYFENIDDLYLSTKDGYNYMLKKYPEYKSKIKLSYLGTCNHGIRKIAKKHPFIIVSCSFLSPVKRVHLIIDALSTFENIEIEWIHFGDGLLMNELKEYARKKIGRKIKYTFKGYTANKEMLDYYENNDVHLFINTSSSEGLPVSIQEAISFGIPVIATNVGSTREAVIHNYNGFLLDKKFELSALCQYIYCFYDMSEEKYLLFRKRSRKLWEDNFNAQQLYTSFFNEIKKNNSK